MDNPALFASGTVPNVLSIAVTCVVFAVAGLIYRNPDTRNALRRQSLVMLLVVLVVSVFFSLADLFSAVVMQKPGLCTASVVMMVFSGNFQHFVIMLITVNLQLTVVHDISTAGFTPYYLGFSFLAALATVLPGAIARVWGVDPVLGICWTIYDDSARRIAWAVGTAHLWTLLCAALALFSTVTVLAKLFVASRQVKKAFLQSGVDSHVLAQQSILTSVTLRILPHPVFLVISNVITVSLDLDISLHLRSNTTRNTVFSVFYAAPPLFFACVVLFFDPSLSPAIAHLFRKPPTILGVTYTDPRFTFAPNLELATAATAPEHLSSASASASAASPSESGDLERDTAGHASSSKDTLFASSSTEHVAPLCGGAVVSPPPIVGGGGQRRRLSTHISWATGSVPGRRTQSGVTTIRSGNLDLDALSSL